MLEKDIKRLEEIVAKLEKGVSLDESLKLFEEGSKLAQTCLEELKKAKGKITMIKKQFETKEEEDG